MKRYMVLALALAAPSLAMAAVEIDKGLMCEMSATTFFQPIVQRKLIKLQPYTVVDSISHFRATHDVFGPNRGGMRAFGMQVGAVFGYASGQMIFARGPGTEPPELYGVIVKESIANVRATLDSVGATQTKVRRVSATETAIYCEGIENENYR